MLCRLAILTTPDYREQTTPDRCRDGCTASRPTGDADNGNPGAAHLAEARVRWNRFPSGRPTRHHRARRADPREHGRQAARSKRDRPERASEWTPDASTAPPQAASLIPIEGDSATHDP